jgi:hypothetical protein
MKPSLPSRRALLVAIIPPTVLARPHPTREWMIGHWIADGERTAARFTERGNAVDEARYRRLVDEFSKMYYRITSSSITIGGWLPGSALMAKYSVVSETDSSVTLRFNSSESVPDLTLFRESNDSLFIRASPGTFEYMKRSPKSAA